jgi:hypothetical protein
MVGLVPAIPIIRHDAIPIEIARTKPGDDAMSFVIVPHTRSV